MNNSPDPMTPEEFAAALNERLAGLWSKASTATLTLLGRNYMGSQLHRLVIQCSPTLAPAMVEFTVTQRRMSGAYAQKIVMTLDLLLVDSI